MAAAPMPMMGDPKKFVAIEVSSQGREPGRTWNSLSLVRNPLCRDTKWLPPKLTPTNMNAFEHPGADVYAAVRFIRVSIASMTNSAASIASDCSTPGCRR